jgi:hypothetical protein
MNETFFLDKMWHIIFIARPCSFSRDKGWHISNILSVYCIDVPGWCSDVENLLFWFWKQSGIFLNSIWPCNFLRDNSKKRIDAIRREKKRAINKHLARFLCLIKWGTQMPLELMSFYAKCSKPL